MKKTIVSTNRLMILAMMMVMTISANAARPLVACYHRDARMQVTSDADKEYVLPLYMPFKRTRGILRNGSSCVLLVASDKSITLFTYKTRILFPSCLCRHSLPELETD